MRFVQIRVAMLLLAVFTLVGSIALHPASANAQPGGGGGGISQPIPCTIGGVASTCTLTVTSFQVINGVLTAVGNVTGGGVTIPFQVPVTSTQATCDILTLILGPLHLDLLGLVVDLNQVILTITAQSGAGNLLGNLLCGVARLLDNPSGNALDHVARQLNRILRLL
jgi:hypothetical protein